jgi:hypothetical protein
MIRAARLPPSQAPTRTGRELDSPPEPETDRLQTEKEMDMISPQLQMALARAKANSLRRVAVAANLTRRRAQSPPPVAAERNVTLRFGVPADQNRLARLATLDSSKPPAPPILLAEADGHLLAALALSDRTVIANPFHPTADLVDLLSARAHQLDGNSPVRRSGRLRSWPRLRALAWR